MCNTTKKSFYTIYHWICHVKLHPMATNFSTTTTTTIIKNHNKNNGRKAIHYEIPSSNIFLNCEWANHFCVTRLVSDKLLFVLSHRPNSKLETLPRADIYLKLNNFYLTCKQTCLNDVCIDWIGINVVLLTFLCLCVKNKDMSTRVLDFHVVADFKLWGLNLISFFFYVNKSKFKLISP